MFGLNLPPEILQLLKNPAALGEQVKDFVRAANALVDAIEAQKLAADSGDAALDMSAVDEAVWTACDAFKAEMDRLPKLTP